MNVFIDNAYITSSRTVELWRDKNKQNECVFVVLNHDGVVFSLFETLQAYLNYTRGLSAQPIELTEEQYNTLESVELEELKNEFIRRNHRTSRRSA